jgi:hypothetical protein
MLGLGLNLLSSVCVRALGGLAPTLNLDFKSMMALPSTITFLRPSNATYFDSTGKLTYAPNNLMTYSNTLTNAAWGNIGGTMVVTGGVADQNGGTSAWTLTAGAAGSNLWNYCATAFSGNLIFSCWARRRTGAGTILIQTANQTNVTSQITSSWSRISVAVTQSVPTYAGFIINDAGDAIDVADCQLEAVTYQTTPSTYVATTSAAYYGARLDYNPATLAARGLLIEEARTNLCQYSNDIANAAWTKLNAAVTNGQAIGPDGTLSMALFASTGGETRVMPTKSGLTGSLSYAFSIVSKYGNANGRYLWFRDFFSNKDTCFDLQSAAAVTVPAGVSTSVTNLSNGLYRYSVLVTLPASPVSVDQVLWTQANSPANPSSGINGGQCYIGYAQAELGAFPTSYIPTAGGAVARSADTASMTGTNFSSWYNATAGTVVVSWAYGMATASIPTYTSAFSMTTSGSARQIMQDLGSEAWYDGTTYINIGAHIGLIPNKNSFAYSNGDNAACLNGGTVATSSSPLPVTPNEATIGNQTGTSRYVNGWIASVVYYPRRLPNATLQSLTS